MSGIPQFLLILVIFAFAVHNSVSNPLRQATLYAEDAEEPEQDEYGINPAEHEQDEESDDVQNPSSERKHKPVGNGNSLIINTPAGPQGTQVSTPIGGGNVHNPESVPTQGQGIPGVVDSNMNPGQGGTENMNPPIYFPV